MRSFLYAMVVFILCVRPAYANDALDQIQSYLNNIKTMQSIIQQYANNEQKTVGKLYYSRPGKLRLEYEHPPILIVGQDDDMAYFDQELDQVSYFSAEDTPLGVLLQEKIDFANTAEIVDIITPNAQKWILVLRSKRNPEAGTLTLYFDRNPTRLTGWLVTDAQDIQTAIKLVNPKINSKLDPNIFIFKDPRPLNENMQDK